MYMGRNVLIPLALLTRIIELLEYWDVSVYDRVIRDDYNDIMYELDVKLQKIQLREAYTNIILANDEDARHSARIDYLRRKTQIADG